ncbi:MAG: hypothetical protein E6Q36_02845 [Chryseobacterium sp.]|nr:MAG: hypothetical protein E6Q36_02845 [Chryseobacterium sp.]
MRGSHLMVIREERRDRALLSWIQRFQVKRIKRTTSELYNLGHITREQLKSIRGLGKGTMEDQTVAIELIKNIYSSNNLPIPSFDYE